MVVTATITNTTMADEPLNATAREKTEIVATALTISALIKATARYIVIHIVLSHHLLHSLSLLFHHPRLVLHSEQGGGVVHRYRPSVPVTVAAATPTIDILFLVKVVSRLGEEEVVSRRGTRGHPFRGRHRLLMSETGLGNAKERGVVAK